MTGAAGFVGRRLVARLVAAGHEVAGLVHGTGRPALDPDGEGTGWQAVMGDLLIPRDYEPALEGVDTVIHAAAATGKATPEHHWRVNVEGTAHLLDAARRHNVRRVVHVSSIAVRFRHTKRYPYAQAKQEAERRVLASGLDTVVLRPTIIVGPGAPVLQALERLARLPIIPVFGDGGAKVQPVFVDDVVGAMVAAAETDRRWTAPLDLGGPERLTIEAFLRAIARARGHVRRRTVHLPLSLVIPPLIVGEAVAFRFMPLTVGQLATFRCDGIGDLPPDFPPDAVPRTGVAQMLERSIADE